MQALTSGFIDSHPLQVDRVLLGNPITTDVSLYCDRPVDLSLDTVINTSLELSTKVTKTIDLFVPPL